MSPEPEFAGERGQSSRQVPVRFLFVQGEERPPVDLALEPLVMTFPHLLVREAIAFLALSLGLVLVSFFFDAPLEEVANPLRTPNPAKAPWYFLGLQELLHYYPPVISGVLLPGLLVLALVVIPYFRINLERRAMWEQAKGRKLALCWLSIAALSLLLSYTGTHPVWPLIGPLWAVGLMMTGAALRPGWRLLATRSLPFWIFFWFLLCAMTLTVIGVFFRGPGWSFTLPWREGIYF